MNIFAVDPRPKTCARSLDDRRLVKMVLETAQLLSTVARTHPEVAPVADVSVMYRPTHVNHPVTRWVAEQKPHYVWSLRLFVQLCAEYKFRFYKTHACEKLLVQFGSAYFLPPIISPKYFVSCNPHSETMTVHEAYRQTLRDKWANDIANNRHPTWRMRGAPEWRYDDT